MATSVPSHISYSTGLKSNDNPDLEAQTFPPLSAISRSSTSRPVRRSNTVQTAQTYQPKRLGRSWNPGSEPGIDPSKAHAPNHPSLYAKCDITVVDFSPDNINVQYFDNDSLMPFLEEKWPVEVESSDDGNKQCRWINVNGLSWDVIGALGRHKKFHRLAIEDVLNSKNRTKADWYSDHTYIVLPLQKLVHTDDFENSESQGKSNGNKKGGMVGMIKRLAGMGGLNGMSKDGPPQPVDTAMDLDDPIKGEILSSAFADNQNHTPRRTRTLQQYHGSSNIERIEYMESHSALRTKSLEVCVEQVSIFLGADNTVVSFFECSAEDIETPILTRLETAETVLRRSADASMVVQAIIDAIIDLAMPVANAYQDAVDELELNVVTSPSIQHTSSLYILASEASQFRATITPIGNLIKSLCDHKEGMAPGSSRMPTFIGRPKEHTSSVTISPLTNTYLGDVEDHLILMIESLDQMRRAVENMTDLIFNTISAYQNESMKQLTIVTILFLPLSFLTGYFGMNFTTFYAINAFSDSFFWAVSIPVVFVITIWVMRDVITRWLLTRRQRFGIAKKRKERLSREGREKRK